MPSFLGNYGKKAVALNEKVVATAILPTGANPRKTGDAVLEHVLAGCKGDVRKIVATNFSSDCFNDSSACFRPVMSRTYSITPVTCPVTLSMRGKVYNSSL